MSPFWILLIVTLTCLTWILELWLSSSLWQPSVCNVFSKNIGSDSSGFSSIIYWTRLLELIQSSSVWSARGSDSYLRLVVAQLLLPFRGHCGHWRADAWNPCKGLGPGPIHRPAVAGFLLPLPQPPPPAALSRRKDVWSDEHIMLLL